MWRTLSYSARLDEPAAGKVLVTAFWGCLGDQGSGTNNYKGPRRGKGIETWPSAFSKYCFKKKTKFLVRHLGRLPEEQKQGLLVATNGSPRLLKSTNQKQEEDSNRPKGEEIKKKREKFVPKGPEKMRNYKWQLKASLIPKGWKVPKGPERMRNYKWMLKTWAGSKRLKGMRDLKEDMYNSDIWLGCLGWEIKKTWRQRRNSGIRHNFTRLSRLHKYQFN